MKEALEGGIVAGFPMSDVRAILYDGSYHDVDSSEMAFKLAGSYAIKEAARRASPVLLEPIMSVEVVVPEEYMGDVIGDINSRRGRMEGMELRGTTQIIKGDGSAVGNVRLCDRYPVAHAGRGSFTMHFGKVRRNAREPSGTGHQQGSGEIGFQEIIHGKREI